MAATNAIAAQLDPGEVLLYAERADAGAIFSDLALPLSFAIGFGVLTTIAVVSLIRRLRSPPEAAEPVSVPSALVLSIFALVSAVLLYVTGSQMLSASSTSYGLTDQRVIIAREFPFRTVDSYAPTDFERMVAWEDEARLDFAYVGRRKGSDYAGRLYVRDPRAWAQRIRDAFGLEAPRETPD